MKRRLYAAATVAVALLVASSSSSSSSVHIVPRVQAWSQFMTFRRHSTPSMSPSIIRAGNSKDQHVDQKNTNSNSSSSSKSKNNGGSSSSLHDTRRTFLNAAAMNIFLLGGTVTMTGAVGIAGSSASSANAVEVPPAATIYISGKPPQVGGKAVPTSKDVKGTRKDPDFLRSIADCRSQCQQTPGPDGLSKSKEDCLSECQDICCKTYEQCTFNIVPRI